jgi:hypothetical protein
MTKPPGPPDGKPTFNASISLMPYPSGKATAFLRALLRLESSPFGWFVIGGEKMHRRGGAKVHQVPRAGPLPFGGQARWCWLSSELGERQRCRRRSLSPFLSRMWT